MQSIEAGRRFLKAESWEEWVHTETDQRAGVPVPPVVMLPTLITGTSAR